MKDQGYELQVMVNGKKVDEYEHGEDTYVKGRKGSEFTLRVKNNNGCRVLAVITVDGRSIMNGEEGGLDSGGYVLSPHESMDIPGWRLDNEDVARFFFTSPEESYAAKIGDPENIGVIGCAVFKEKPRKYKIKDLPLRDPLDIHPYRRDLIGPNPSILDFCRFESRGEKSFGDATTIGAGLGTGFGKKTSHRVKTVEFERCSDPDAYLVIRYGDQAKLKEIGVKMVKTPCISVKPISTRPDQAKPFPREVGCTPPAGWQG